MKFPRLFGKNRKEKEREKKRIINAIRGKTVSKIKAGSRARKQLNVTVDSRLHGYLKRLAVKLSVDRDIVAEHTLEQGIFYMELIIENDDRTKRLRQHLTDDHQLSKNIRDNESILRIGEGSNISELLDQVELFLESWHRFEQAVEITRKTRNTIELELYEKQLLRAAIIFASWLEQNRIDKPR